MHISISEPHHLPASLYSRKKLLSPPLRAALRTVAPGTACRPVPTELKVHILRAFQCTLKTEHRCYFALTPATTEPALWSSFRLISISQLHTLLRFHLLPIYQVVFLGPYSIKDERSNLRGSFTLRCLQRLSRPYVATQLCPWQDNWCTRGMSIPVLSY